MSITKLLKRTALPDNLSAPVRVELRGAGLKDTACLADEIAAALGISQIIGQILVSRGVRSAAEAQAFIYPALRDHLVSPQQIKNIEDAALHILRAVKEKCRITIFSDFDVDGLTSGVQLLLFLDWFGAQVDVYVPNRFSEGYGLSKGAIERLAATGTQLLVTVDCGISSVSELALAKRLGLRTVVIDHHEPGPELPPADVVVDPAQDGCPFREYALAAAGVVWMLLIVLRNKAPEVLGSEALKAKNALPDPKDFLDLASIGTICDMVPLVGMNRLLAHRGLEALRKTQRCGLSALLDVAGLQSRRIDSGHVAYVVGPRMNAAGRLGDANDVIRLLTTKDAKKAKRLAQSIDRLNSDRRTIEEAVLSSCLAQLSQNPSLLAQPAIALYGENYHLGVIGIVAQRLVERFNRPVAVMGPGEIEMGEGMQRVVKGSVRSVDGFHVADNLSKLARLLLAHGGHAAAGGFSLSLANLENFKRQFVDAAASCLTAEHLQRKVTADMQISLADINFELAESLTRLAPFGVGNPSPVFITASVNVDSVMLVGQKHLRLRVSENECVRNAIAWGMHGNALLRKGEQVNIAYQVEINTYKGVSSVQLNIKEVWRPAP